jgi:putative transposase
MAELGAKLPMSSPLDTLALLLRNETIVDRGCGSEQAARALSRWGPLAGTEELSQDSDMTPEPAAYFGYRFPTEVIRHAVWLYHLFSLSFRDVELILAERGVVVSYESIRRWCIRFGTDFATRLRKRRPKPGDTWYMDEVYLRINGELFYLWRAVDQYGVVLDILVQKRRNGTAAKRFFKRLLAGLKYKPRKIVTDGLRSYGVAQREVLPNVRHRTSRYLNNRAENSHGPTRRRERQMQRFKSPEQAQRFLSAHVMIYGHFRPRRHLMTADHYRRSRNKAFRIWRQETCVQMPA